MFWFIAATSLLNLALGYALAAWSENLLKVSIVFPAAANAAPAVAGDAIGAGEGEPPAAAVAAVDSEGVLEVAAPRGAAVPNKLSMEWEMLLAEAESAALFVEASVQVLRLEVGRYRQSLVDIDAQVRRCRETGDAETLAKCLEDLARVNVEWLARQADAGKHLTQRKSSLGALVEMGASLCDILEDQRAQIETTCNNIKLLDFADSAEGCTRLTREISRLVDMAHGLRDRMQESLACIAVQEGRFESLDRAMRTDGLTDLNNRTGLEVIFHKWRRDDPDRQRQLSMCVLDVDRLGSLNEQYGALVGDRVIQGLAHLLASVVRRDRGFDVVVRIDGQQFLCFFGDTGPRNAVSATERIRQTVAAARFEFNSLEIELAVSCGVTEAARDDTLASIHHRLAQAVRAAKAAGRNCTVLDDGNGLETIEAPKYDVKPRLVKITD